MDGEGEARETDGTEVYRLHDQIGFLLRQATQRHIAIFGARMGDRLTTTQWSALVKLAELEPISQNQLGRETSMDVATVKGVVDRLVGRGFVRTAPDPRDGRRLVLGVTDEGRAAIARNLAVAAEVTRETLAPLTPGERILLAELLRRIA
ncbi:MarR family winged helix-turn-helix transcriptional regulator [Oharaeibacter diazotrophicus]|uniref:MarR family transcriptional regulator n=1 Tax=Oharaeibacter diazotrophicus TaxID=1920512 RepID=A0A4R6R5E3_9HYPH|nr:MarR family transcriptional regulator [Oharaeibacter diazotrophicus]TDP81151.1 MarR family transcriptional regulator [Oharaeibacter diazotrophicus]BBE74855.1 HTH-type transcriptional repressor NicR [Pleomorphomonas sp. SM30]GLS75641.1 transcriptional regulator [Oharaeibacter diazotrophicus]